MTTNDAAGLGPALADLLHELVDGPPGAECYVLNPRDAGLLRSLARITWQVAAQPGPAGGASIAAHVDHVRYGISLFNRWAGGEPNPFATADWAASWKVTVRTEQEWQALREALATETHAWKASLQALARLEPLQPVALKGVIASVAHLAYHLGAIRQIDAATRGPEQQSA